MKRYKDLYRSICFKDFIDVYQKEIRVNTKNKEKIKRFDDYYSININRAYNYIKNKNYVVGKYNIFLIREPKYRIIMSQNIVDKLINHVISHKILGVLDKSLIDTNIATRKNKGTHFGLKLLKKYLNEFDGVVYALKFDISKYFYNIDHDVLISLLRKKIKDKDGLDVIERIIRSTDMDYVNEEIIRLKNKEIEKVKKSRIRNKQKIIDEIKRIPLYKKGKGLPIGNMSSQIMAIYYLNEIDHFVKERLGCRYYIRYMDDGIILSNDKEYLKYCLDILENELGKYKLSFNSKTKIINVRKEGIDFLGFHFYIKSKIVLKVRNITKKRFKSKIKNGDYVIYNSYKNHFKWGACYNLFNKYTRRLLIIKNTINE